MPDDPQAPEPSPVTDSAADGPDVDPAAAAAAALRRATRSTAPRRSSGGRSPGRSTGTRDPQTVGQALDDLLTERGWQADSAIARLATRWPEVVGSDIADHVVPVSFQDGVLVLQAESTAWATQVRLLMGDLRTVIDAEVGAGVVTSVSVLGPASPSWVKGPRTVRGRGPRDTYG